MYLAEGFDMILAIAALILISVLPFSSASSNLSEDNERIIQLTSNIGNKYFTCPGTAVLFDDYYWEEEEFVDNFLATYKLQPVNHFINSFPFEY